MKEEHDGVEFELSEDAQKIRKKASKGVHKKQQAEKRKMTPSEARAKREEKLAKLEAELVQSYQVEEEGIDKTFYIYAIIIAVFVSIVSFYVIFTMTDNKTRTEDGSGSNVESQGEQSLEDQLISDYQQITGYVTKIDEEYKTIEVLNIADGIYVNIVIGNATAITDEYGRALVFGEIEMGDGVDISYIKANNVAVTIDMPNSFFTKSNKTNVIPSVTSNSIEFNGTNYFLTDYTIIVDNEGNEMVLAELDKVDVITFKGVSNYVNYIEVLQGHGTIQFTNIGNVTNPKVEINTKTMLDLSDVTEITVAEGEYKVIISGDNITPYLQYVNVTRGGVSEVNLSMASGKMGNLYVVTNTAGITLKIGEKEYDENKPITLPYGDYTMTASKLNYTSDIQNVVINKPNTTVSFNLVPVATNVILDITSTPLGAEVYIDNQLAGITPLKIAVAEGPHAIKLKSAGKYDISFDIDGTETYYKYNYTLVDKPADTTTDTTTTTETPTTTSP